MKRFVFKLVGLGFVFIVLFFIFCGDDLVIVDLFGFDILLVVDLGFLSLDSDVIINDGFVVKVCLFLGDVQFQSLFIDVGNFKLEISCFIVNSGVLIFNNLLLIIGVDKDGVIYIIDIIFSGIE